VQLVGPSDRFLRINCRPDFIISRGDIERMFFLMREKSGYGLAAPQIGIDARLFVTDWDDVFVNPRIIEVSEPVRRLEGCLSLPDVWVPARRWNRIRLADMRWQKFTDH
jgi:peptide deformylase